MYIENVYDTYNYVKNIRENYTIKIGQTVRWKTCVVYMKQTFLREKYVK